MAAHVYEGPGSDGQYLCRASDQDSNEGLQAQSREKGVITSKNRLLASRTAYKVGTTTNNNRAKPAWEIQCDTIITMPSRGKSISYLFGLPTTAQSPTQKSYVSTQTNRADTILTIRVVSTRIVSSDRYRGIHIRYSSAHFEKLVQTCDCR